MYPVIKIKVQLKIEIKYFPTAITIFSRSPHFCITNAIIADTHTLKLYYTMPTTPGISKSFRLAPEVIEILTDYSTANKCNLTEALTQIILASANSELAKTAKKEVKGLEATELLALSQRCMLSTEERVAWVNGSLYLVGKNSNGTQDLLRYLFDLPEEIFDSVPSAFGYERHSLTEIQEALVRWNELQALVAELPDSDRFFSRGDPFLKSQQYDKLKAEANEALANYHLEQATAASESANDQIATNDIEIASSPLDEVVVIANKDFRVMFAITDDQEYSDICLEGASQGWVAPSGDRYFRTKISNSKPVWKLAQSVAV